MVDKKSRRSEQSGAARRTRREQDPGRYVVKKPSESRHVSPGLKVESQHVINIVMQNHDVSMIVTIIMIMMLNHDVSSIAAKSRSLIDFRLGSSVGVG